MAHAKTVVHVRYKDHLFLVNVFRDIIHLTAQDQFVTPERAKMGELVMSTQPDPGRIFVHAGKVEIFYLIKKFLLSGD